MITTLFAGTVNQSSGTRFVNPLREVETVKIHSSAQSAGNFEQEGSSETIRVDSFNFNEWLGGLIDGDGYLSCRGANGAYCEITVHTAEVQMLHKIKNQFGGSVTPYGDRDGKTVNAVRWRLGERAAMQKLVIAINGSIRTVKRYEQLTSICAQLQITPKPYKGSKADSWLLGFFDAEGCISIEKTTGQPRVSLGQKERKILEEIKDTWGGSVTYEKSWDGWLWHVGAATELQLLTDYFAERRLQTPLKQAKLITFRRYLQYKARKDPADKQNMLDLVKRFNSKE